VQVKILPPQNVAPQLVIQNGITVVNNQTVHITLGEPIRFDLTGTDADLLPDKDLIKLTLLEAKGNVTPEGYVFTPAEGKGRVTSVLSWSPDCSIFKENVYENVYTFKFRLADDRCFNNKADTVLLTIRLKDINNSETEFLPPNVFTPNGDGCNDYFAVEGTEPCPLSDKTFDPDELIGFPPDNCIRKFESVRIYNRWGNSVFESTERKFRWYAPDQAAGVYYYFIKFTDKEYKGSLSVRF
jgi:hypothetical protein